jgi:tetratricopeptide (TPR) repeat protein
MDEIANSYQRQLSTTAETIVESDLKSASLLCRRALVLEPSDGRTNWMLGLIAYRLLDVDAAERRFRRSAHGREPHHVADAMNGLAAIAKLRRVFPTAVRHIRMAIASFPGAAHLWANYSDMLRVLLYSERAHLTAKRGLTINRDDLAAQQNYLLSLEVFRDPTAMRRAAHWFADSREPNVLLPLTSVLMALGEYERCAEIAERIISIDAASSAHWLQLARARYALEDTNSTIRAYRCAAALAPHVRKATGQPRNLRRSSHEDLTDQERQHFRELATDRKIMALDGPLVLSESWAVISGDRYFFDGIVPWNWGASSLFSHVVMLHQDRILSNIPESTKHRGGEAILLGGCENFGHWIKDWSSKVAAIELSPQLDQLSIVVARRNWRFASDLLRKLKIPSSRLLVQDSPAAVYGRLWVPLLTHGPSLTSGEHIDWLRRRLDVPAKTSHRRRRIFMSRRMAKYRRIANLAEVQSVLSRFGVEEVFAEDMSLDEQLELFASTSLWVGVLGAGFASVMLCPRDCTVIELTHRRTPFMQHETISRLIGQSFRLIFGEIRQIDRESPSGDFDWDFSVPVSELEQALADAAN